MSRGAYRFDAIEGLRGYLALWVMLGHAWAFSQVAPGNPVTWVLAQPTKAVLVFMVLSGFVITHLLIEKAEPYPTYIVRRFFRLFPVFVVCCALGWLTYPMMAEVISGVPWAGEAWWEPLRSSREARDASMAAWPLRHVLAHLTMLHGAIPSNRLIEAPYTLLGPAWSISTEWQFYVVAPAVLWALKTPARGAVLLAGAGAVWVASTVFGRLDIAFLGLAWPWFLAGILGRLALPYVRDTSALRVVGAAFAPLLTRPWQMALGEASYSLYLVHYPVLTVAAWLALQVRPGLSRVEMLVPMALACAASILLAFALRRWVELPGIELGRRLSRRSRSASATSRPVPY